MGRPRTKTDPDLPSRMYRNRQAYYYVAPDGAWHNLGKRLELALVRYARYRPELNPAWARKVWRRAKINAGVRGLEFAITVEDVVAMAVRANGKCSVSGVPFSNGHSVHRKDPWAPSIDRIDSRRGYTPDNCRLVCTAVNLAINEWGEDVLRRIVDSMAKR